MSIQEIESYDVVFSMKFGELRIKSEFSLELLLGRNLLDAIKKRSTEMTDGLHDEDFKVSIQ